MNDVKVIREPDDPLALRASVGGTEDIGCSSTRCRATFEIDAEEALRLRRRGCALIADTCPHGPDPTDRLDELRDGFGVYTETAREMP